MQPSRSVFLGWPNTSSHFHCATYAELVHLDAFEILSSLLQQAAMNSLLHKGLIYQASMLQPVHMVDCASDDNLYLRGSAPQAMQSHCRLLHC